MIPYEFELVFSVPPAIDADALAERLAEAGCDDATLGVGLRGRVALLFAREAGSAAQAVLGAIRAVRRAVPEARLLEASPDLVGLTDVAEMLGVSRQNVRKLLLASAPEPPAPVHGGRPTIWRLAKVLRWLREEKAYRVPDELLEVADTTMQVNLAVGAADTERAAQREIRALLA
ncbi:MAG TPA: DNA-binding protein [Thermoleophilia bacterium]|nr:DNA-binding protein [Thermoleophilia bacterium]